MATDTTITWLFDIGDLVLPKVGLEIIKWQGHLDMPPSFPHIGRIILRKYDECHGGCGQKHYTVEMGQNRLELAEDSLVLASMEMLREALTHKEKGDPS